MKRIELKPNWYPYHDMRKFRDIIHLVNKFFDHGGYLLFAPVRLLHNGIYIFAKKYDFFDSAKDLCYDCQHKNKNEELSFQLPKTKIPKTFYDCRSRIYFCKTILLNNRYAGEYCPRINCLWLTDWVYDHACLKVALKLLPQVLEKLQVKKKEVETKRSKRNTRISLGIDAGFEEMKDWKTYSPIATRLKTNTKSLIGTDKSGLQVEIRPFPAYSPKQLVKNIKRLIEQIDFPISVLGNKYPLRCHIHIGLPKEFFGYELCFVDLLDRFLGEKLIELSGEARESYKILGVFRTKDWGFEYKTLPTAILLNPKIARVVFKITKNTIEYLIKHEKIELHDDYTENLKKYAKLSDKEICFFLDFIRNYWNTYDGHAINHYWTK